jgi:hypothetical protein
MYFARSCSPKAEEKSSPIVAWRIPSNVSNIIELLPSSNDDGFSYDEDPVVQQADKLSVPGLDSEEEEEFVPEQVPLVPALDP